MISARFFTLHPSISSLLIVDSILLQNNSIAKTREKENAK